MAAIIGVFILGWMIGSGRTPVQQSLGLDCPETQPITAVESQAKITRNERAPDTARPVAEPSADSITRQKSRQLPAGRARDSLVGMERRLTSATTDDLEAIIFLVTHDNRRLSPTPAARQTIKTASGITAGPPTDISLTGNPQDTVAAAVESTASNATRKPDKTVPGATKSPTHATANTVDEESTPSRSSHTSNSTAMTMQDQETVTEKPTAVTASNKGPWVINLVSTQSKADADRIMGEALSRDIQTEQQEVTVNGKHYWRVQITGFSTAEYARNHSEVAKEKLGLKSVWIMKR